MSEELWIRLRILHAGDGLVSGDIVIRPVDPCENIACRGLPCEWIHYDYATGSV